MNVSPSPVPPSADTPGSEPVVRWTYEPSPGTSWGVATCVVSADGREERWQSASMYVTEHERKYIPEMLARRLSVPAQTALNTTSPDPAPAVRVEAAAQPASDSPTNQHPDAAAAQTGPAPFVLMRWTVRRDATPDDVVVIGIYPDLAAVEQRVERIANANRQYPLRQISPTLWEIGPDEDEGFFGNRPVRIMAQQPKGPWPS
jgi:hypothetical protein